MMGLSVRPRSAAMRRPRRRVIGWAASQQAVQVLLPQRHLAHSIASDPAIPPTHAAIRLPAAPRAPAPAAHQFGKAAAGLRSPARREIGSSARSSGLSVTATAQMEVRRRRRRRSNGGAPAPAQQRGRLACCSSAGGAPAVQQEQAHAGTSWQQHGQALSGRLPWQRPLLWLAGGAPRAALLHTGPRLAPQGFTVKSVPTKPIEGQKTGTSGLRKKTKVFMSDNYLANWCVQPG